MVVASFPAAKEMRGQRGQREVTEMMQSWCTEGMFTMGDPSSPTNAVLIPAVNFLFSHMNDLDPQDPQRIAFAKTLAYAAEDCQGVQAREIMRMYSDLTCQSRDLPQQILYFLSKYKEEALQAVITERHPKADLDHHHAKPWEQRPHLYSAYTEILGDQFGLPNLSGKADRFLAQATQQVVSAFPPPLPDALPVELWCDGCGAQPIQGRRWSKPRLDGDTYDLCQSCYDAAVDKDEHQSLSRIDPPEPWSCNNCTLQNEHTENVCGVCQHPRESSTSTQEQVKAEVEARIEWDRFMADLRADINNQSEHAERFISPGSLTNWAAGQCERDQDEEASSFKPHDIYFDYRPPNEFQENERPKEGENEYKPFLSTTVMRVILVHELQILRQI
eukprot:TRINITY_DN2556_c0_g1_i3.p1 TRINITY_DN2556_c0_g1~~TRINITY_DN2556_c0_g1_i3.p1  ORF type:complete len:389 (+),score=96.16 TRINITY_DN2556_c0_g1_i3:306-1472(+)